MSGHPSQLRPSRASTAPHASDQDALCGAIWLMGQCSVFVRNREHFTQPPFGLKLDDAFVERLTDLVTGLALRGLSREA